MVIGIYNNYAEVIFKKVYKARVPIISTYSEHELDVVGIPMNVIGDSNKNSYNELVLTMITINDMVEKYNNGFNINIIEEKDMKEIYHVIQKHLEAWQAFKVHSLNQTAIPVDDLILLDKFASEIFTLNKRSIVKDDIINKPSFTNDFSSMLMGKKQPTVQDIDYDTIERTSIAPEPKREGKYDLNTLLM